MNCLYKLLEGGGVGWGQKHCIQSVKVTHVGRNLAQKLS